MLSVPAEGRISQGHASTSPCLGGRRRGCRVPMTLASPAQCTLCVCTVHTKPVRVHYAHQACACALCTPS
eukprot:190607-Rhodomonas_salina.1